MNREQVTKHSANLLNESCNVVKELGTVKTLQLIIGTAVSLALIARKVPLPKQRDMAAMDLSAKDVQNLHTEKN